MKKIISLFVALLLMSCAAAFAAPETIDLAEMTKEDLQDLIERAQTELSKFEDDKDMSSGADMNDSTDAYLLDAEGVKVSFNGAEMGFMGLEIKLVIENDTDNEIILSADKLYVNGWELMALLSANVEGGKKSRSSITVLNAEEEADVSDVDDLEEAEFVLEILDPESYRTLYTSEKIVINFKK